jgi:hypothetical protein
VKKVKDQEQSKAYGLCRTESESDPDPPITLARDGATPTNAGDANCMEPLAQRASGLETAGVVPAARRIGVGRCCARTRAGRGGEGLSEMKDGGES